MIKIQYKTNIDSEDATCEECSATLLIYSKTVSIETINNLLNLLPTKHYIKGEKTLSPWGKTFKAPSNIWILSSENQTSSHDLRDHLEWMLSILIPLKDNINSLQKIPDVDIHIRCTWVSTYGDGGPSLWPEHLKNLAMLNLPCYFDFYCREPLFAKNIPDLPCTDTTWNYGSVNPELFIIRGWTSENIEEAITQGLQFPSDNRVNLDNAAIRYIHPSIKKSIVIDATTRELIHIGKENFIYWGGYNEAELSDKINLGVQLLNEGTTVSKGVSAVLIEKDIYQIDAINGGIPSDEKWQFYPGNYVYADIIHLNGRDYLMAMGEVPSCELKQ